MEKDVIISICVALDIALIAMAYPILISQYLDIGAKYSSKYLIKLFDKTLPQKAIIDKPKITILQLAIYNALLSFIPLIVNQPPPFGWDNCIINNSALLWVFISTILLTVLLIWWLNNFLLYRGNPVSLLQRIFQIEEFIEKKGRAAGYEVYNEEQDLLLKTADDLSIYASKNRDWHLIEFMVRFYDNLVSHIREESNSQNQGTEDSDNKIQYEYPTALHQNWFNLVELLAKSDSVQMNTLLGRVVGCHYFYGRGEAYSTISNNTYATVWECLLLISKNSYLVEEYWAGAYEQARFVRWSVDEEKDQTRFEEFHIAFGGLLVHQNSYKSLKEMFAFSRSIPPEFHIFPMGMDRLFRNLKEVYEGRTIDMKPWDIKYPFPEVKHLGAIGLVSNAISAYLILLIIRQFGLQERFTYENHTAQPNIPNERDELINWKRFLTWLVNRFNQVLSNSLLLEETGLNKIVQEKGKAIQDYVAVFNTAINDKYVVLTETATLNQECINRFEHDTTDKITSTFHIYKDIFKAEDIVTEKEPLEISVRPRYSFYSMERHWFTEECSDEWKYSFHTDSIINNTIKYEVPGSYTIFSNRKFLLPQDSIVQAIDKLRSVSDHKNYLIIGIELRSAIKEILINAEIVYVSIPTTNSFIANRIYVLNKHDMPRMTYQETTLPYTRNEGVHAELKLLKRVLDPRNPEDEILIPSNDQEPLRPDQVVGVILFNAIISAKKNRDIVEIRVQSPYEELGIPNLIEDIVPIQLLQQPK